MKKEFSTLFLVTAILLTVCLIASNLFAVKVFHIGSVALPGAVVVFPLSYILGDCIAEVWGYRKARLVIWTAFAMNALVVLLAQLVIALPAASFWDGGAHFDYVFHAAPRIVIASLLAFLAGSNLNAIVMSRMKVRSQGRHFGLRAIVSSLAGEAADSLIFIPLAFWGMPIKSMLGMMLAQVGFKVLYELLILPLTARVVKAMKAREGIDTFDLNISYNPFKIKEI